MNKVAKFLGWAIAIGVGLALIASMVILIAAQFHADANQVVISLGETEIAVQGVFDQSAGTILIAWLSVAAAMVVGVIAVTFAIVVATLAVFFALGVTVVSLGSVAVLLASPLIAIALIAWLIIRNSRKSATAAA
jgi:hypothetical protein